MTAFVPQAVLWLVAAAYIVAISLYVERPGLIVRGSVTLFLVALVYVGRWIQMPLRPDSGPPPQPQPQPPPPPDGPPTEVPLVPPSSPSAEALRLRSELGQLNADIGSLQQVLPTLFETLRGTISVLQEGVRRIQEEVRATNDRLSSQNRALLDDLEETVRQIEETPAIATRYRIQPARVQPKVVETAERFLHVLRSNAEYRKTIVSWLADSALVEEVEAQLSSMLERSQRLHKRSGVTRGTASPRMQAWAKDNLDANNSFLSMAPLLRRLRRLDELVDGRTPMDKFLEGMRERELTAMEIVLVKNPLGGEQPVRMALARAAEAVLRNWLMPAIRLYQLLYEALPVEDDALLAWTGARSRGSELDLPAAIDSFRAAASAVGFRYVHHELYGSDDPFTMQADLSPGTPRYTFAQWIAGEEAGDRALPVRREFLGRVTVPRLEEPNGRGIQTEIVIIGGER